MIRDFSGNQSKLRQGGNMQYTNTDAFAFRSRSDQIGIQEKADIGSGQVSICMRRHIY